MRDMTLTGFIAHLTVAQAMVNTTNRSALDQAARVVEREAKAIVGKYQTRAGPFAGWAELAQSTKNDRVRQGFSENEPGLRSGEMRDSIGRAVGRNEAVVGSNNEKLVRFELGTSKQQPRSVLGIAAVHKGPEVARILGQGVVKHLVGQGVFGGRLPIP
jgi:hypothetical protein